MKTFKEFIQIREDGAGIAGGPTNVSAPVTGNATNLKKLVMGPILKRKNPNGTPA